MTVLSTIDGLYRLLLFTAMILLFILLYNNIVLYRRKLSDLFSLMLMASAAMCTFELLWDYFDGHTDLKALTYIGACGYVISFVAFATILNRFFLEQFELGIRNKLLCVLLYDVPNIAFFLLCATTPWTGLVFRVDEGGVVQEMLLFRSLYYVLLLSYLFTALGPAIYYAVSGRYRGTVRGRIAKSLIIFGILVPLFFVMEILVIRNPDSDYLPLSPACAVALVFLSANVSTHLLLETQAKVEAVEADMRIAAGIQTDALPPGAPEFADHPDLELRASMNTAREVGGDFYDYFSIDDHHLCFLIADVSGKGMPAALFMMKAKTMIKDYALTCGSTAEIFTAVNRRLSEGNDAGMFATAWIGILDTEAMTLQYTNAGHSYPILKRFGEPCTLLKKKHGLFLAAFDDTEYRRSELQLQAGDRLFLYTDGVTEAHNPGKQMYGMERLNEVIEGTANDGGEAVLSRISEDVNHFADGEPQFDDITMMVLTIQKDSEKEDTKKEDYTGA